MGEEAIDHTPLNHHEDEEDEEAIDHTPLNHQIRRHCLLALNIGQRSKKKLLQHHLENGNQTVVIVSPVPSLHSHLPLRAQGRKEKLRFQKYKVHHLLSIKRSIIHHRVLHQAHHHHSHHHHITK